MELNDAVLRTRRALENLAERWPGPMAQASICPSQTMWVLFDVQAIEELLKDPNELSEEGLSHSAAVKP